MDSKKIGQTVLVTVILAVLCMLVLPLAPAVLDFMLAVNLTGSLFLLLVAISLANPIRLTSFPAILLVCTLYRLGLNVSSTKLILMHGHAGDIIATFGNYAVGGNVVVGFIVFLILVIIQFVVVNKGGERIAEVAARFALDALPGKQMSVDADLRSGLITSEQAMDRRAMLLQESRFYGAMDGAMKFVKGDAIAGICITLINILGGFIVGVVQQGMTLTKAIHVYTVLTIGDGLVAQIPALLISLTAGFVVTRVADHGQQQGLGEQISAQLATKPSVLFTASGIVAIMAFLPGFPTLLFLFLSLSLLVIAIVLLCRAHQKKTNTHSLQGFHLPDDIGMLPVGQTPAFVLEVNDELFAVLQKDDRWEFCLRKVFPKLKAKLSYELGLSLPELKMRTNTDLGSFKYQVKIYGLIVGKGYLTPHHFAIKEEKLQSLESPPQDFLAGKTQHGSNVLFFEMKKIEKLKRQGVEVIAPDERLLSHLLKLLKKHASEFIGIQEVKNTLIGLEKTHPELVREVVPRMLSIPKFTEVMKRLVDEAVPINNYRLILEVLAGLQPESKDATDLVELVRMDMKHVLTQRFTVEGCLSYFSLEGSLEQEIMQSIQIHGKEHYLGMEPTRVQEIASQIHAYYKDHRVLHKKVVILTLPEIRRYVRKIIETDLPQVAVLSYQELSSQISLDQREVIMLQKENVVPLAQGAKH